MSNKLIVLFLLFCNSTLLGSVPEPSQLRQVTQKGNGSWARWRGTKTTLPDNAHRQGFDGLVGTYDPYLFLLRDKLRVENGLDEESDELSRPRYLYQDTQQRAEDLENIQELIAARQPNADGHREVGTAPTFPRAYTDDTLPCNRLLLEGPSGTGKTATMERLAIESGCEFVEVPPPNGCYRGEPQEITYRKILEALEKATTLGCRVLVYFDECHKFAARDSENADMLWRFLDKFEKDPRVKVVCATYKVSLLDEAFIRRFKVVSYQKPTKKERTKIVHKYAEHFHINLSEADIEQLANVSDATGANIQALFAETDTDMKSRNLTTVPIRYMEQKLIHLVEQTKKRDPHPDPSTQEQVVSTLKDGASWIAETVAKAVLYKKIGEWFPDDKPGDDKPTNTNDDNGDDDGGSHGASQPAPPKSTPKPIAPQPPRAPSAPGYAPPKRSLAETIVDSEPKLNGIRVSSLPIMLGRWAKDIVKEAMTERDQ